MEKLIEFINDLTDDLFYEKVFVSAKDIYTCGGCYEFAKIIKHFIPDSIIYISNPDEINHCAIYYNNELYDATGNITYDIDKFHEADKLDFVYMDDCFGGNITNLSISKTILYEMKYINIDYILDSINPKKMTKKRA